MSGDYDIRLLGEGCIDSPVDSTVFVEEADRILVDASVASCRDCDGNPPSLEKAGPRKKLFFDPAQTRVAIVTCGGLCPGLNDVIRGIVMVSWYQYGIRKIMGIRYGYEGLVQGKHEPMELTPEVVEDIHQDGGSKLGSSRGHQDMSAMVDFLEHNKIDILYAIGGDGTQRGALQIAQEISNRNLPIGVVGVPKTIDNDIALTDRTFGFETAVAASQNAIRGAHMEAKGALNGVGLVKLMGRHSGFVAVHASLASSDVNMVLVPEAPFSLDRVMAYLEGRLTNKSHAVVVIAEGAGQDLLEVDGVDASGNKRLGDIGPFMKAAILAHFKGVGMPTTVKYIDPSYIIRSAPATPNDSVFCFQLAGNAVHAGMTGRTALVISELNGKFVHVPTELAIGKRKQVDTSSLLWQSVLDNTGQPRMLASEGV